MISLGFDRDFSGEKGHLAGWAWSPGEWHLIWHADGHAATGRRRSGWLLLLDARRLQEPVLIWLGELPCLHPRRGLGLSSRTLMIYTLMSSEIHRILSIEPERSAVGEQGWSQRLRTRFSQRMHPALTRRPEIRVRRSSKMVSPCADGQRPLSLIGPAPRRNIRYPRQRLLTARAREPSIRRIFCAAATGADYALLSPSPRRLWASASRLGAWAAKPGMAALNELSAPIATIDYIPHRGMHEGVFSRASRPEHRRTVMRHSRRIDADEVPLQARRPWFALAAVMLIAGPACQAGRCRRRTPAGASCR